MNAAYRLVSDTNRYACETFGQRGPPGDVARKNAVMRSARFPLRSANRRRVLPVLVASAVVLAACGGGAADDEGSPPAADAGDTASQPVADDAAVADGPVALTGVQVDLVGPDVVPTAEIATNTLPSVVLDDVSTGRKVNFRNLVPQDKPILLWMYAPH